MSARTSILLLALFCFLWLTQGTGVAQAQNSRPHFTDIIVTTSDTHLLLFGELRNSLTEEMLDGLHSGIPVQFSFFVELKKSVPNWVDDELVSTTFTHTLSFDTLKEVYVVQTEESSKKKYTTPVLEDAVRLVNEVNGLKIIELSALEPEKTYRLRIKADLHKKSLPLSLQNVIPFVSWWDYKTDWYTVEFIY